MSGAENDGRSVVHVSFFSDVFLFFFALPIRTVVGLARCFYSLPFSSKEGLTSLFPFFLFCSSCFSILAFGPSAT